VVKNIQWSKTDSLTLFDRYSAYQGRSLHIYLGFVPM